LSRRSHGRRRAVAVVGRSRDAPCRLLLQALEAIGTPALAVAQSRLPRAPLWAALDARGRLAGAVVVDGVPHALEDLAGLYLRPADDRRLFAGDAAAAAQAAAWTQAWIDVGELATCRVVNRISAMASNASKPMQAQVLAAAGFEVPPSIVSNDPPQVEAFARAHGELIFKSASGVRSIVSVFDAAARRRLPRLRHGPTLFQKRLRGTNVRVHVVGDRVFATEIESPALDYRYAARSGDTLELRATRLGADIDERCVRAANALGLPFAGLDLMLADDGAVYCFEANPSPGYSFYEDATGQPISQALAAYLAG
jgi:glutathione synthase/RimK-type ligase-like ATP-grasp enzyme